MKQDAPSQVDIVMLGTFALWNLGTLQARALPLARSLTDHGLSTAIVTTPWDMPSEAGLVDIIGNVTIANTRAVSPANPLPAVRQQVKWVRRLNPRMIHLMKPKGFGGMAARMLEREYPLVVDSDDWEGDGGWNDSGQYTWLQRKVFQFQEVDLIRRGVSVTAASTLLEDRARLLRRRLDPRHTQTAGTGAEVAELLSPDTDVSVVLIENGIEKHWAEDLASERRLPPSWIDPPVVLLYSRFAEFESGWLPAFAQALAPLVDLPVTLRVIGSLEEQIELGQAGLNLEILGYVATHRLPDLLGSATVAVYPYRDSLITRSKQSVKLLELLAAGTPVIGSDVGDVKRVIGDAGIAITGADPSAFAACVAGLIERPGRLDDMSHQGISRVKQQFGFDSLSRRLVNVYRAAGLV